MHWTELAFYTGFVVLIVAILLVDLLIFDRHSHEVSIKEALSWTILWIILGLGFGAFLYYHGEFIHGIHNMDDLKRVIQTYDYNVQIIPGDYQASIKLFHKEMAINYITGYLLEKTLSVDNLFVMILIFNAFNVKKIHYKRVLFWGILGAIVLRTIFIFAGAALVLKFRWILYIFGVFLIYSGIKVFFEKGEERVEPQNHPVIRFLARHFRIFPRFVGEHFFIRRRNKALYATPLLLVLIFIEFSDIVFAFDSIPAIFSVTLDPYVVFFSNIFAILGLRAMFFLLAKIVDKFYMLQYGVGVLLTFIGIKLLFSEKLHELGFTNIHSLIFILVVLTLSIVLSLIFPKKESHDKLTVQ